MANDFRYTFFFTKSCSLVNFVYFIGLTITSNLHAFSCLFALCGSGCKQKLLLIPILITEMLNIILVTVCLISACVLMGFAHLLSCGILSGISIVLIGWMIYFWIVIYRAYKYLGNFVFGEYHDSYSSYTGHEYHEMNYRFSTLQ